MAISKNGRKDIFLFCGWLPPGISCGGRGGCVPPVLAVASATENPARMLSLPAGELKVGAKADILLCSRDMTVKQVLLSGRELL